MKKEIKKVLRIGALGHLGLWSVFFAGVFCTLIGQTNNVTMVLIYAGIVLGLLCSFAIGMKYFMKEYKRYCIQEVNHE